MRFGWAFGVSLVGRVVNVALVAQVNFGLGILVRQQLFVNGLSRLVMTVPKSWPLGLWWVLALTTSSSLVPWMLDS